MYWTYVADLPICLKRLVFEKSSFVNVQFIHGGIGLVCVHVLEVLGAVVIGVRNNQVGFVLHGEIFPVCCTVCLKEHRSTVKQGLNTLNRYIKEAWYISSPLGQRKCQWCSGNADRRNTMFLRQAKMFTGTFLRLCYDATSHACLQFYWSIQNAIIEHLLKRCNERQPRRCQNVMTSLMSGAVFHFFLRDDRLTHLEEQHFFYSKLHTQATVNNHKIRSKINTNFKISDEC